MTHYTFHTIESAPDGAKEILSQSKQAMGFIPNLYAGLANAPPALEAYRKLADLFDKTSLTPIERQVVHLTVSVYSGCEFCVAAHSMIARKWAGVPGEIVDALRAGKLPTEPKLKALSEFTRAIVDKRGWVLDDPSFAHFIDAGYSKEQALEVILGITQKY